MVTERRTSRAEAESISANRSSLEYTDDIDRLAESLLDFAEKLATDYLAALDVLEAVAGAWRQQDVSIARRWAREFLEATEDAS